VSATQPRLLGVIGAPSGQGRNVVTLNLGVAIAQLGKRAVIADFGASDLRRMLGLFRKVKGLKEFAEGDYRTIRSFICPTPAPNLCILSPGENPDGVAPFAYSWEPKVRLMRALAALEADFVLADLGTDMTADSADFFSMAGAGILVVSADPREVLRCYEFLKLVLYRTLRRRLGPDSETAALLAQIERAGGSRTLTIAQLTRLVRHRNPDEARVIDEICDGFVPLLIVDAGQSQRDMELGDKLRVICRRYLSIRVEYLGFIYEDAAVDHTHGTQDPVVIRQPDSRAAVAMHRIAHKCIHSPRLAEAKPDVRAPAEDAERAPAPAQAAAGDRAITEVLARVIRREIGEVERRLEHAEQQLQTRPKSVVSGPAKEAAKPPEPATERMLKTAFSPADLRALEELIESLDDDWFPDPKWKWKVRALTSPLHVVHHLMSRGVRRDFFYREAPGSKAPKAFA